MRNFNLFADCFQVYLQDEAIDGDLSESWTDEAVTRLLAAAPGTVGIHQQAFTGRPFSPTSTSTARYQVAIVWFSTFAPDWSQ